MKKSLLKVMLLLSIILFGGCAVDGTVKDSDGNALSNATVTAQYDGNTQTTTTDEEGYYEISQLNDVESVEITVEHVGYYSKSKSTTLNATGATLDFVLKPLDVAIDFGTIRGKILDIAGHPLANVTVSTDDAQTTTDENGVYTLSTYAASSRSVSASLEGYATNSRNIEVVANAGSVLNITLAKVDTVEVFSALDAKTVSAKGASVAFEASSIVNSDNTPFSGNVVATFTFNQVSSYAGQQSFPGDYLGENSDGTQSVLQSYGFIDVTLEDENGNALKLAEGKSATLTYPMDSSIESTPANIPLWYYDTKKGIWVEDGVATFDANTNSYTGEVTHFTTWNLDAKFDGAEFSGCITDTNGTAITDATLIVDAQGLHKVKHNIDAEGKFTFINAPSNLEISLKAIVSGIESDSRIFTLTPSEVKVFDTCLVFDAKALQDPNAVDNYAKVEGKIQTSDGTPIANTTIRISTSDGDITTSSDENGTFATYAFKRPNSDTITLDFSTYINGSYIEVTRGYTLNPNAVTTNLGIIEVKVSHIKGCVVKADGSSDFSGYGSLHLNSPFNSQSYSIDNQGAFSFTIEQNSKTYNAYAFMEEWSLTSSFTFTANKDTLDLTTQCIVLEDAIDSNKSVEAAITSSNANVYLKVVYDRYENYEYPPLYGEKTLLGGSYWEYNENNNTWSEVVTPKTTSGAFNLTQNGIYYIYQAKDGWEEETFDGTISYTLDDTTKSLNIEDNATSYSGWAGYAIELYQGSIKVIELNREIEDYGECEVACAPKQK